MSIVSPNGNRIVSSIFDSNTNENSDYTELNNSACRSRSRSKKRRSRSRSRSRRKSRSKSRSKRRCSCRKKSRKRSRRKRSRSRSSKKRCGSKKRKSRKRRIIRKRRSSSKKTCSKKGCVWRESTFAKIKQGKCCKQRLNYKLSPYALWVQQNMKTLKGKGDAQQIMRALAKSWKCLSPMDKAKFYHKAAGKKNQVK